MSGENTPVGLGDGNYQFGVCIGNRPPFMGLQQLDSCRPLVAGEIKAIGDACGNGWRKVFNVYAKLLWAMKQAGLAQEPPLARLEEFSEWQQYRDALLLQPGSGTALLFEPPATLDDGRVHLIMGRTWAKQLLDVGRLLAELDWLNPEFAIDRHQRLIVCPYFDYRQLSNIKIEFLVSLLAEGFDWSGA
ncbi:DUF6942 family protein [Shewanella sedimentimangrovi]|uniref:Uncharacterized protein n=1 Tax=Shewanella sedimentimangrovi TaxID=2814293 RepID=A0ABX7R2P7_9GAMM|nr:hypothetical protein [Shewanella sedimentimangrovi]QSX37989.1 hypothetical protein JYB85_03870 [Shewanella sedimentimangrovi]